MQQMLVIITIVFDAFGKSSQGELAGLRWQKGRKCENICFCVCGGIERRILITRGIIFEIANEKFNYEGIRSSLGYPEL